MQPVETMKGCAAAGSQSPGQGRGQGVLQSSHRQSDVAQSLRAPGKADNQPRLVHILRAFSGVGLLQLHSRILLNTPVRRGHHCLMKQRPRERKLGSHLHLQPVCPQLRPLWDAFRGQTPLLCGRLQALTTPRISGLCP